jgi:PUA domain protein
MFEKMAQKQWSKSDIKSFLELHSYAQSIMDKKSAVAEDDGLLLVKGKPYFFSIDNEWYPTLHLLLENPTLLPKVVVDKGAIRFVVNGADIMRPGIVTADSWTQANQVVVIVDETVGKPIAVGKCSLTSEALLATSSGKHIKNVHRIGDEIWNKK